LKLPNKAASAVSTPAPEPESEAAPMDDTPMDDMSMDDTTEPAGDAPFDKTPFDAGVEADEEEDPKTFIEQLTGKLATTLRSYTKDQGKPDFGLEKYIINSVIAATHTAEMDEEDRKDIIKKINDSGKGEDEPNNEEPSGEDMPDDEIPSEDMPEDEEPIDENDANAWGPDKTWADESRAMWEEEDNKSSHFDLKELLDEEEGNPTRYMFFSNLEQMQRQAGLLLDLDEGQIEAILNSGHDWAADHVATAKESFDQVFDFLMNETKGDDTEDNDDYSEWSEPMELQGDVQISEGLQYHLDNKLALGESVYRYGSDEFFKLLKEVKTLFNKDLIKLNENDIFILNDIDTKVKLNGQVFQLGHIMESEEDSELLNEAEYKGKKVEIGKPKRGGSKKFYVYVKNPKTDKVKKVSFGAKDGGGNLSVKLKDPKARKAFADRHNCEQKNDKTTPGYWSCRLPRYAKLLGLSGGGKWW
jgi:hypothetical protein